MAWEDSEPHDALAAARRETVAAFANRALVYAALLDELEAELGTERAVELMKRGMYRRGLAIAEGYRGAVLAGDLEAVAQRFIDTSACAGALFEPSVAEGPDDGRLVLSMTACPLVDAWRQAGIAPDRVDLLCEVAAAIDYGTFEGAGLKLRFLDRQACPGSSSCLLELTARVPE